MVLFWLSFVLSVSFACSIRNLACLAFFLVPQASKAHFWCLLFQECFFVFQTCKGDISDCACMFCGIANARKHKETAHAGMLQMLLKGERKRREGQL
ncbi:hypothetical protein BX070DRAFT_35456 [Coemansia spiralis]|nr:hypothetical protein BX070DRAFT_35456 [Coemansia spiralis]